MLYKKIFKNIVLMIRGKVKMREIPRKIAYYYSMDNNRLVRRIKRTGFSIDRVICRPITPEDGSRYIEFRCAYSKNSAPERKEEISVPECKEGSFYYIALYKNKIIGRAAISKVRPADTDLWMIAGMHILHDLRGYGIGERLLKTVISAVEQENSNISLSVSKDNKRAIRLYEKLGFQASDEKKGQLTMIFKKPEF